MPTQDGSGYGQFGAPAPPGPDHRLAERARSRSSSARSAPTITAIRTPGCKFRRRRAADPGRRADRPGRRAADPHPQARQARHHAPDARQPATEGGQSGNVIAEVPGRDPKAPILLVGGHLDSWDQGTGAIDDGAGRRHRHRRRQADHGRGAAAAHHPRRLVRRRGAGRLRRHGLCKGTSDDRIRLAAKAISAPTASGASTAARQAIRAADAHMLQAALAPLGIVPNDKGDADGSDIGPTIGAGVPWIVARARTARAISTITTRPTTRSTRSTPSSCARTSPRGPRCSPSCRAESSRSRNGLSGVERPTRRQTHAHRYRRHSAPAARRLPGQQGRRQRHDQRHLQSATSPKTPRRTSATPPQNIAADIGNEAKATGDKIENKVGDNDGNAAANASENKYKLAHQPTARTCPARRMVGETGFEPATLCSQSRCATRLRYSPPSPRLRRASPPRSCRLASRSSARSEGWWARKDSNLQPSRYERPALPLSYRPPPVPAR